MATSPAQLSSAGPLHHERSVFMGAGYGKTSHKRKRTNDVRALTACEAPVDGGAVRDALAEEGPGVAVAAVAERATADAEFCCGAESAFARGAAGVLERLSEAHACGLRLAEVHRRLGAINGNCETRSVRIWSRRAQSLAPSGVTPEAGPDKYLTAVQR